MRTQAILEKLLVAAVFILILMAIYQMVVNRQFDPVGVASGITMMFSAYSAHRHMPHFLRAKYNRKSDV
jgi:hypothetical protein